MSKTISSIRNSLFAFTANTIIVLVGFASQRIFLMILNEEYAGVNGLLASVLGVLSIAELGIGNAIIYNLYKPLADRDTETINSLAKFYKKAYEKILAIIIVIGISLAPFINIFIGEHTLDLNFSFIYILLLLDVACSYIFSYKRSILYADQKNYIVNIVHTCYYVSINIVQLVLLYITRNYYLYVGIKFIFRLAENIIIDAYVNRTYTYLNAKNAKPISTKIKSDIDKKVKALSLHKIASFLVFCTDDILISKICGLATVGLYSNYYLITESVNKIFAQALQSATPSIGHLLLEGNKKKSYEIFRKIRFMNFWIASFTGTAILVLVQPFIKLWLGEQYLLTNTTVFVIVFVFYQQLMRIAYNSFKEPAGIFHEDRFVPIVESILNIAASILLGLWIGLPGIFIGTIISGLALWCYSYPKYVYRNLFDRSYKQYVQETLGYIATFIFIAIATYIPSLFINIENPIINLITLGMLCLIVPNLIIFVVFGRTENMQYFLSIFIKGIKKLHK